MHITDTDNFRIREVSLLSVFTTCAAEHYSGGKLTLCRQICEVPQTATKLTGLIKLYMSTYRTAPPCAI